jgi:hypothetical protein
LRPSGKKVVEDGRVDRGRAECPIGVATVYLQQRDEALFPRMLEEQNIVGPRIGKSRGSLKRYAASPLTARASRQPTKLYSASPPGAEALDEPLAKTAVALLAHPRMPL